MKLYLLYFVKDTKVHYYIKKDTYTYFKDYAKIYKSLNAAEKIAKLYDLEIIEY